MIEALPVGALRVAPSHIHGTGCFIRVDVQEDTPLAEYLGEKISGDEAVRRNDPASSTFSEYILEVTTDLYLDARLVEHPAKYVNHSCEANCYVLVVDDRAFVTAKRNIAAGEELTYDYAYDEDVREPCQCGASSCRGYI